MAYNTSIRTFAANLLSYGASEVASKASRLLVVIVVARTLDLTEVGIAAAAMAAADILKSLTENGVVQRIISAKARDLDAVCATASRIFWVWCLSLFALQAGIAGVLYASGSSSTLALLVLILGAEYLFMPAGLVQVALAMRAGKLRQTAAIAGAQVVGANLMAAAVVFVWPSAIALLLPRLLSAPIWLIAVRRLHPWRRNATAGFAPVRPFLVYGRSVLGTELVKAIRLQADKIVVGMILGGEALGLYFMAFNAGLSLSNAFTMAFATVLFPALSQSDNQAHALRQSICVGLGMITPVIVLQALCAPVYVPILLGPDWADISSIVAILCLVAIPTTLWTATAGWHRANNRPEVELMVTSGLAVATVANTYLLAPYGLMTVAIGYACVTTVIFVAASWPGLRAAFLSPRLQEV
ncbi:oligosaccharide flippase family protein [Cognatishimia sp. F0-27]|nr:oligosaccharide flippase family protein [Cognatishimia sp. F0-27]